MPETRQSAQRKPVSAAAPQPAYGPAVREQFARALEVQREGKRDEAEKLCNDLVSRFPKHFGALSVLGAIALATGRHRRAEEKFRQAIAANPGAAGAYNGLGEALRYQKKPVRALENYTRAIALNPDLADAYYNRASLLYQMKRFEEALSNYDKVVALRPDSSRAHFNRGNTLRQLKRPQAAIESYDKAIAIEPGFEKPYLNRGTILSDLNRTEEALACYEKVLTLKPDSEQALYNRANVLRDLKRFDEAIAGYDQAIARKADYSQAHWNKGNCLLQLGNYEAGLPEYEHRAGRAVLAKQRPYTQSLLQSGHDIAGKTLFIYPEFYLGDMIQFCRYAKLAERRGAKVVLSAQNSLHQLLRGLSATTEIIAKDAVPESFDFHTPLMSLPLAFGTTLATIPGDVPYLYAEPERVEKWKQKLGQQGFRIGVCWQGSKTAYAERLHRSFSPFYLRGIAKLPGVRLISLHKVEETDPAAGLPSDVPVESFGKELDEGTQSFLDSAALIQSLDLVITTDTAIAHLAGALARPTWLVSKDVPDWRWLLDRSDSPWYPTMRLFHQKRKGEWKGAFDDVEAALKAEFVAA